MSTNPWTDVSVPAPSNVLDPLVRIGVELCLEGRLMSWATGLPAGTNYERWFNGAERVHAS